MMTRSFTEQVAHPIPQQPVVPRRIPMAPPPPVEDQERKREEPQQPVPLH
ncbi:MAG: hypothetical protein H6857_00385 [Rhodospirillales bacterium]|nr:hypothetical protein [Rhodospirillales bacterium]MCB9979854.1 hypothetical protein [Rhodospirillales bacterium]